MLRPVGLFCVALIKDFKGWRTSFERQGSPDAYALKWRRRSMLMFAWFGLAMNVYIFGGFAIRLLMDAFS